MAKTKTESNDVRVTISDAPKASEAIALLQQAQGLTIVDRVTHQACREQLKGAKELKRVIAAHYAEIKKPLNDARNVILDKEKRDLAPVEQVIALLERKDVAYINEQRRIEQEAARAAQEQAEAEERARRQREAEAAEAKALELEAASDELSERERRFVERIMAQGSLAVVSVNEWIKIAAAVGYKDGRTSGERLFRSAKIQQAIAAAQQAAKIRKEAEAKQAAPVVVEVEQKPSEIAQVSGTSVRTYYSCGDVDIVALMRLALEAHEAGDDSKLLAVLPNTSFLNDQARQCKEMFEKIWPACRLVKKQGIAG